jgi:DNA-binding CsgD family transcriptional regulator
MQITPLTKHIPSEWVPGVDDLTRTEKNYCNLMLAGMTKKEIAKATGVGPKTSSDHVANICKKLNVSDQYQLMALVIEALMPIDYDLS